VGSNPAGRANSLPTRVSATAYPRLTTQNTCTATTSGSRPIIELRSFNTGAAFCSIADTDTEALRRRHEMFPKGEECMHAYARVQIAIMAAALVALQAVLPEPVAAEIGDISVGGVWVCRLTQGGPGLTLEQRVRQINQCITTC
jgi:hypothetical protein